jgi:hypothetical protein
MTTHSLTSPTATLSHGSARGDPNKQEGQQTLMPTTPNSTGIDNHWSMHAFKLWFAVFIIVFSISFAIVHTSINTLSESSVGGLNDSYSYVDAYYGKQVIGHWRYRIVTIELARLVPVDVERLLQRDPTPYRRAHIHFAVVNLGFLTLTGLLLFAYARHLVGYIELAILAPIIYLTSRTNLQSAGAPMVDPGAFFFLLLGTWAILRCKAVWLLIAMLFGIFTKETTLLLWPLLWLADHLGVRQKLFLSALLIPGTLAFLTFRFILYPDSIGASFFNLERVGNSIEQLRRMFTFNGLIDTVSSFSLFWVPAIFTVLRLPYPSILGRWLWFIVLLLAMILFLGGNYGRILFMAFPVVIPLALLGIGCWIGVTERTGALRRQTNPLPLPLGE